MDGGDAVGGHVHRPLEGGGLKVGGTTTTIGGLHKVNWI